MIYSCSKRQYLEEDIIAAGDEEEPRGGGDSSLSESRTADILSKRSFSVQNELRTAILEGGEQVSGPGRGHLQGVHENLLTPCQLLACSLRAMLAEGLG